MANHRAGKRDASRVDIGDPADLADATGMTAERSTQPRAGGKRKAVKPARAARTNVQPVVPHRAGHASGRKNLLPGLPSAPSLVGAAALIVAATGAVTVGNDVLPAPTASGGTSIQKLSAQAVQANALTGTSKIESTDSADNRKRAVSRDSQREALEDAADEELQAAAEVQAKERNAALQQLAASAEQHADEIAEELAAKRWVLPLSGYDLTARFGYSSGLWASTHTGLDFAAPSGTPIVSVASGVVTSTAYDGSYGNRTIVTLDDGTEIWYCHQTSFAASQGDSVAAGQTIGYVGSTGNSTGPHLHLEVRPGAGDPVDPYAALVARGLAP